MVQIMVKSVQSAFYGFCLGKYATRSGVVGFWGGVWLQTCHIADVGLIKRNFEFSILSF